MTRPIGSAQFDTKEVPESSLVVGTTCDPALMRGKTGNRVEAELFAGEPLGHVRHLGGGRRALQYRGRVRRGDAKNSNAFANFQHQWC